MITIDEIRSLECHGKIIPRSNIFDFLKKIEGMKCSFVEFKKNEGPRNAIYQNNFHLDLDFLKDINFHQSLRLSILRTADNQGMFNNILIEILDSGEIWQSPGRKYQLDIGCNESDLVQTYTKYLRDSNIDQILY